MLDLKPYSSRKGRSLLMMVRPVMEDFLSIQKEQNII